MKLLESSLRDEEVVATANEYGIAMVYRRTPFQASLCLCGERF